ncbi:unnamed protein product, partial [Nesidiocoris tenuis]
MELLELPELSPRFNVTSNRPLFNVNGIESGSSYQVHLYAVNGKGRSDPFILQTDTFKGVAKYTESAICTSFTVNTFSPEFPEKKRFSGKIDQSKHNQIVSFRRPWCCRRDTLCLLIQVQRQPNKHNNRDKLILYFYIIYFLCLGRTMKPELSHTVHLEFGPVPWVATIGTWACLRDGKVE